MKKTTLNIVYRDVKNKNGWRIPFCIWKKMFDSPTIKELFKTGSFYIYPHWNVDEYNKTHNVPDYITDDAIGKILSIDFDNLTAEVQLNDDIETDGYSIYFLYYGEVKKDGIITNAYIKYATLFLTLESAYEIEK